MYLKHKDGTVSAAIQQHLDDLRDLLQRAAKKLSCYCGRGFLKRFLTASSDTEDFKALHRGVQDALQVCGTGEPVLTTALHCY
jgi:hypothetical protein